MVLLFLTMLAQLFCSYVVSILSDLNEPKPIEYLGQLLLWT